MLASTPDWWLLQTVYALVNIAAEAVQFGKLAPLDALDLAVPGAVLVARRHDPDPTAARTVLTAERYAEIDVHRWDFGGRPE